jgi:biopolymer transport protein ExbB
MFFIASRANVTRTAKNGFARQTFELAGPINIDPEVPMDVWLLIKGGGPVAALLLLVSMYAAFIFFYRLQILRRASGSLGKILEQIRVDLLAGSVRSAIADARRSDTPAARVVVAGLERVQLGPEAVQAALNQASLLEEERVGRGLSTLSTVAQVAPMLGLLGTVFGMIRTFSVFSSVAQPTPTQLAGGISEALVTTAAGLIVAVLAHLGHSTLARQFEMVFSNVDRAREALTGWLIEAGLQASTNPARAVVPDAARESQALEVSMVWPAVDTPMRG